MNDLFWKSSRMSPAQVDHVFYLVHIWMEQSNRYQLYRAYIGISHDRVRWGPTSLPIPWPWENDGRVSLSESQKWALHHVPCDLFGVVKTWPFGKAVCDLQLGDEKVTLNHLVADVLAVFSFPGSGMLLLWSTPAKIKLKDPVATWEWDLFGRQDSLHENYTPWLFWGGPGPCFSSVQCIDLDWMLIMVFGHNLQQTFQVPKMEESSPI